MPLLFPLVELAVSCLVLVLWVEIYFFVVFGCHSVVSGFQVLWVLVVVEDLLWVVVFLTQMANLAH